MDDRTKKLAKLVVEKLDVKKQENVIISGGTEACEFITELYKQVLLLNANPILRVSLPGLSPFFYKNATKEQIEKFPDYFDYLVKHAQKYIGIDTEVNTREMTSINPEKIIARQKVTKPISNYIVNQKDKIKRSTVGFPCLSLAQDAEMSLEEYEDFVYGACLQDWNKLGKFITNVLSSFKKGKEVHLLGEGVDLKMKIHGDKAMSDLNGENIPMGEVFMAPVRESLEGFIKFDYNSIRNGKEVCDIYLKFKDGKVIEFDATKNKDFLKQMLETDENASYVGELGIGLNPKITKYTNNLLFDEKIGGTIHLALGMAYDENGGGNDSAVHWDLVKSMKNAKIILDGKVVQENGVWKI